jgi:type IV pilus assembly protein PilE
MQINPKAFIAYFRTVLPEGSLAARGQGPTRRQGYLAKHPRGWLLAITFFLTAALVSLIASGQASPPSIPAITLATDPLFATASGDKPAITLALSVETPTVGAQYLSTTVHSTTDATYKRAQGRTALAELLQQQERFATQRNCYLAFTTDTTGAGAATAAPACGFTAGAAVPFKTFSGDNLSGSAYLLMADACPTSSTATSPTMSTQDCIRVIAKPIGNDPAVGSIRMTSTGTKDCTAPGSNTDALAMPSSTLCWP